MDKKPFYITSTLPYVNAEPHVGFAMELIRTDAIARYKKLMGYEVFFNTGTDEHGQKLLTDAEKVGKDVKTYVDEYAEKFRGLKEVLGISDDVHFIRTTDAHHEKAAQAFWNICKEKGFIYKKNYQTKYCVGCELEKTDSELNEAGECPIHPGRAIELRDEENYFFKFSAFQEPLLKLYKEKPELVVPEFRFREVKSFVERGLEDFSISRLKSKMSWGVQVPDDEDHVMYVWFDALVNYISTIGWPENTEQFEKFWKNGTPTQYAGKDNLRQQSAMWQAMLLAADLPTTNQIVINGFITGDGGIKMSKSIGNVVNPYDVVKEYGTEALRFFLLSEVSSFEDSPFTMERFKQSYNAKLANGIGNLTSRIMKMAEANITQPVNVENIHPYPEFSELFDKFEINKVMDLIWKQVSALDLLIQTEVPFKIIKTDIEKGKKIISDLVRELYRIGIMLKPVLPETSDKIINSIIKNKVPETPLFLRKD